MLLEAPGYSSKLFIFLLWLTCFSYMKKKDALGSFSMSHIFMVLKTPSLIVQKLISYANIYPQNRINLKHTTKANKI